MISLRGTAFTIVLAVTGLLDAPSARADDWLTLVLGGTSRYEILNATDAPEGTLEAARELQRLIEASTHVRLALVHQPTPGRREIVVGDHPYGRQRGVAAEGFEDDEYRITVREGDLFLVGHDDVRQRFYRLNNDRSASAGTYFAVVDFCRRYLRARWYMPGPFGEEVAPLAVLRIPARLELRERPRFAIRYLDIASEKTPTQYAAWRAQGVVRTDYYDGPAVEASLRWGRHLRLGSNRQLSVEHSWYQWLPAERPSRWSDEVFGRTHPEYYSVPGGRDGHYYYGSDGAHGGQLCIVRAEVAAAVARRIIAYARRSGARAFSLSPNDGDWECARSCCGDAGALGADAALTSAVVRFANEVAGIVAESVPDARFGLYAYHWTLEPPAGVRPDARIDISDVHNGLPFIFDLPAQRTNTERLVRGWRAAAANVTLTTYYTFDGYYSLPWSTPEAHDWLVRLLDEGSGSAGLRMNYAPLDVAPMGLLGPDPWVLSELLWNPKQSADALREQYFAGAYGRAAAPLREYYRLISRSMERAVRTLPYREANGMPAYIDAAYGPIRRECADLIQRARTAAESEPERVRWRVDRVARGWSLAELTLEVMDASRSGHQDRALTAAAERRRLLEDRASLFALAPASNDATESELPLAGIRRSR